MTDAPKLSPEVRENFKAALASSADELFEQEEAAAFIHDYLRGRTELVLRRHGMFMREIGSDLEPETELATDDDPPSWGQYL